ncbi:MAG TPA: M56 family metallopeptidase [Allosphingosinicella sp.]
MTAWLTETAVTLTLLLLLVLAVRRPVARAFGAGWAYALWAVPALRLLLPPLPQLAFELPLPTAAALIPAAAVGGTAPPVMDAGPWHWLPLILALWAVGAVLFLGMQWLSYRAFARRVDEAARPARPPRQAGIEAVVSAAVDGPLAMGLLRPRIVLPADFDARYSASERRLALAHEITHHRRGDIWWNLAATLVLALNWFNPVAWIAYRAFRADQELSCDAAVAARASDGERCDYARALVKSASRPGLIAACALNGADQLKQRLRMMGAHRVSGLRRTGGAIALAAAALAGFAVGGSPAASVATPVAKPQAFAAAVLPSPAATVPTPRAATPPRQPIARAKPRPQAKPAVHAPLKPEAAPAVPDPVEVAAAAPPEPPQVRIVRLERSEVRSDGAAFSTAQVFVFRASGAPQPTPPEILRAIKAARAGDLRVADAGAAVQRLRIHLQAPSQGE